MENGWKGDATEGLVIRATAKVDISNLRGLQSALEKDLDKVVRETAFEIQAEAQDRAPVDTGAMRASVFTVTNRFDGGAASLAAARRPRRSKDGDLKVAPTHRDYPRPKRKDQAVVAVGVVYGFWVNLRTRWFTSAVWQKRKVLRDRARAVIKRYTK